MKTTTKQTILGLAVALASVGTLVPAGAQSYNGVSCEDVRALSKSEQAYWIERLNLSSSDRHRIWAACYKNYRQGRRALLDRG